MSSESTVVFRITSAVPAEDAAAAVSNMGVRREAPDFGSLVSLACRLAPLGAWCTVGPPCTIGGIPAVVGATCGRLGIDGKMPPDIARPLDNRTCVRYPWRYLLPR